MVDGGWCAELKESMVDGRWWMVCRVSTSLLAAARHRPSTIDYRPVFRQRRAIGHRLSTIDLFLGAIDLFLEGGQGAAVGHEIGGGGGAEGAEAIDQAEHEIDEGFVGGGEGQGAGGDLEGSVAEGAAEVEALVGAETFQGAGEALREAGGPAGTEGEDAGDDGLAGDGGAGSAGGNDGDRGAAEAADRGGFAAGVADEALVEILLDLEDGVNAFGGNVESGGGGGQEGGGGGVVDGDVDLAGAAAVGIDDEGAGGAVAVGKIAVQKTEPMLLGDGAGGGGMFKKLSGGEVGKHLLLDPVEHAAEVNFAGVGVASHESTICGVRWRVAGSESVSD